MYQIEPAGWRDLNALRSLEKVCFPKDAWPIWDVAAVLTLPNVVRLKAVAQGEMIGFIGGDVRASERLAWIVTVGVLPEWRRQGVGRALLEACQAQLTMPRVRLNVRTTNTAAIRLYEQMGYQRAGLWPAYYSDGEDALIMEKHL